MTRQDPVPLSTESLDSVLGSPSSQKILRILFCWNKLPAKEISKKTNLSDSQVYSTLKNLESIGLITSASRGIYSTVKTPFAEKLGEAYLSQLVQLIGKELYSLVKNIDRFTFSELDKQFSRLVERWEPLIDRYYSSKASFLATHILERAQ